MIMSKEKFINEKERRINRREDATTLGYCGLAIGAGAILLNIMSEHNKGLNIIESVGVTFTNPIIVLLVGILIILLKAITLIYEQYVEKVWELKSNIVIGYTTNDFLKFIEIYYLLGLIIINALIVLVLYFTGEVVNLNSRNILIALWVMFNIFVVLFSHVKDKIWRNKDNSAKYANILLIIEEVKYLDMNICTIDVDNEKFTNDNSIKTKDIIDTCLIYSNSKSEPITLKGKTKYFRISYIYNIYPKKTN